MRALVRVKDKFQLTLPEAVRKQIKVEIGDLFEVQVRRGLIVFKAKRLVDAA